MSRLIGLLEAAVEKVARAGVLAAAAAARAGEATANRKRAEAVSAEHDRVFIAYPEAERAAHDISRRSEIAEDSNAVRNAREIEQPAVLAAGKAAEALEEAQFYCMEAALKVCKAYDAVAPVAAGGARVGVGTSGGGGTTAAPVDDDGPREPKP